MSDFFVYGFIVLFTIVGWQTRNLTLSGSISAVFVGIVVYTAFHINGLMLLGAFFLSSSLWSKFKKDAKSSVDTILAKTSVRDWQQVIANGGPAVIFAFLFIFTQQEIWTYTFAATLAGANSDTWASEIGPLSNRKPVSIRSLKRVPKGTSGAVSLLGMMAGLVGSFFIAMLFGWLQGVEAYIVISIAIAGFLGNLVDTMIGATIQVEYTCSVCHKHTEAREHCKKATMKSKGLIGVNNEIVNFLSSFAAGIVCLLIINYV